eukprot:495941_1
MMLQFLQLVLLLMFIVAGDSNVCGADMGCSKCSDKSLKEFLDCLSLSTKYDCFMNEGITEVKQLLLFKSPINSIHFRDLQLLQNKCDLNTLQLITLKRNLESIDQYDVQKEENVNQQIFKHTTSSEHNISVSNNELCDTTYAFVPIILRTFYPEYTNETNLDDDVMVRAELVGILPQDALNYFTNIQIDIDMVGFSDMKHILTFEQYSVDNRFDDDRLITFTTKILNSTAVTLQSNLATSELFRLIDPKDIDKMFDNDFHATKINFVFSNEKNENIHCIDTIFNYTINYVEQIQKFETIDFKFIGLVEVDISMDDNEKYKACKEEYNNQAYAMKYTEMLAVNKEPHFMQSLTDFSNLEYPLCGTKVKIDNKQYRNNIIHKKWPKKLDDLETQLEDGTCLIACKQDYKRSYLFTVDYYMV